MPDDTFLAIAEIADSETMRNRMNAAVTQQVHLGNTPLIGVNPANDPLSWVGRNRYVWASSPGWGAAWAYAKLSNEADADYDPAKDEACITDGMILATVQALGNPQPPDE
jgi:hypothetical protein